MYILSSVFNNLTLLLSLMGILKHDYDSRIAETPQTAYQVIAAQPADIDDVRWAEYLQGQLQRRLKTEGMDTVTTLTKETMLTIQTDLDSQMPSGDYSMETNKFSVKLRAADDATMLWLIYQCIPLLAQNNNRLDASDLPPAQIGLNENGSFCFEYRSIYSPTNANEEMLPIRGTHHVDYDWGLWGHNLPQVFEKEVPQEAWAQVNGKREKSQLCFSSEKLYNATVTYILDNYGSGKPKHGNRFSIMPQDNELVCTCTQCQQIGNTPQSATPAVSAFIRRLAKRFPYHTFFTSSYATTQELPSQPLPDNTGVWISAMELPFSAQAGQNKATTEFALKVRKWTKVVGKVYVWDYMRNFDNYLIPYPCLNIIRERLQLYKKLGIKGIFYNGSGDDYATFDDVQTYVLSALLRNPDSEIDSLVSRYFKQIYPVAGELLNDFYLKLEKQAVHRAKLLPYYGGMDEAVTAYLDIDTFHTFYSQLDRLSKKTAGNERGQLNRLLTALQLPLLEVMRCDTAMLDCKQAKEHLALLSGHKAFKDMNNYREADGCIESYITEWQETLANAYPTGNLLQGHKLRISINEKAINKTPTELTDGRQGFVSDYHNGWTIMEGEHISIEIPACGQKASQIVLSLLYKPKWRMMLPQSVEVWQDGALLTQVPLPKEDEKWEEGKRVRIIGQLPRLASNAPVIVKLLPHKEINRKAVLALDEIEWYEQK